MVVVGIAGVLQEEWRPVVGYEDLYEVSNGGRVRSLLFRNGTVTKKRTRLLRTVPRPDGYLVVGLLRDGHQITARVHRLVLEAFEGPCPSNHEAAHLDGNPLNPNVTNLRWVTPKENNTHKKLHGTFVPLPIRCGGDRPQAKLTSGKVQKAKDLAAIGMRHHEIAKLFGVGRSTISRAIRGATWS